MAGNIKGITIEFRGETTKLEQALRTVKNETKGIDSDLKKVNNALKFNPKNTELIAQKQTLLRNKISATTDKLKLLKQEQEQMDASGVDKNSQEYMTLRREIIETESKLKNFNKQLNETKTAKLTALGEEFEKVGEKMQSAGKTLTKYVTVPLVAAGTVAANKFADVDKTMQLTNATMGNTAEEAALLSDAMKKAAAESTFGMSDAATAMLNFARAGLTAEEAAQILAPAMALAAGEGGNLDVVSAGLVGTINAFEDSFENAALYADVFANACNNSALEIDSLVESMGVAAPVFNSAGYSVRDAAVYLGIMADRDIDANKAANALKTGLARLVSPAKQGAEALDELDISVTNADGSMKSTLQIQKDLHDSFADLSESEQIAAASAIFGKNQMAPWLALINAAPSDLRKLNLELAKTGTAEEMQASMMAGFGGSIERLKSGIDVFATSMGEALAPMLQIVIDKLQELTDWFNSLSPETQTTIATIGVIVAAVGPLLVVIGALVSAIGSIMTASASLSAALAVITGPIGAIIIAIGLLVAAGVFLYENWDTIKEKVSEDWETLKAGVAGLRDDIVNAFENVKTKITSIWNTLKTTLSNAWNSIKTSASSAFTSIKNKITEPFEKAKTAVQQAIDTIKGLFPLNIGKIFGDLKLPHFKIEGGSAPFGIGGKGKAPSIGIDWYANGGIFDSPSIIGIGEAGPEAVVPLNTLWDKLDAIAAASSGGAVVVNVYGSNNMSVNELAAAVEQRLINMTKRRREAWS